MSTQDLGQYIPAVRQNGPRFTDTNNNKGILSPLYEYVTDYQAGQTAATWGTNHTCFVLDNGLTGTFQIVGASVVFGTASSSGTLQVEVATGTTAAGSGTNQLTGTMSIAGTANTVVNGTMIASPTTLTSGARINLIFGGTVTSLANCCATVVLKRLT